MKEYKPDVIIVRITKMSRAVFEAVAPNLKVLVRHGAGYDTVGLKVIANYEVKRLYAPVASSTSVAETALMLMLYMSRNVTRLRDMLTADFYDAKLKAYMTTLNGKTAGLTGCGNIRSRMAKRCLAMEVNVLCYDPYKLACDSPEGVEVVRDTECIFREGDYVSLHTPDTSVTRNMTSKETLLMMKPIAFLINIARGVVVNEQDLYEACKDHVMTGAALDAAVHELILPDTPLTTLDNVLITPRAGGSTVEAAMWASHMAATRIVEMYEGKESTWPIPDIDYETVLVYTDTIKPDRKPVGMYDY